MPFFVTIVGVIELSMRFPGSIRLGGVPMSPCDVGLARLPVEVSHLVVEDEAGAADDDVRTEAAFERVGAATPIPAAIEHREVRRLVRFLRGRCGHDVAAKFNAVRGLARSIDRGQLSARDVFEVRSATGTLHEVGIAEDCGRDPDTHGACASICEVKCRRRQQALRLQVVGLEDVEHLDECDAP